MGIYLVNLNGSNSRLVEAPNKVSAINHVVRDMVTASSLSASEVAHHMNGPDGILLERVSKKEIIEQKD